MDVGHTIAMGLGLSLIWIMMIVTVLYVFRGGASH
jgi:hypothetical protein